MYTYCILYFQHIRQINMHFLCIYTCPLDEQTQTHTDKITCLGQVDTPPPLFFFAPCMVITGTVQWEI